MYWSTEHQELITSHNLGSSSSFCSLNCHELCKSIWPEWEIFHIILLILPYPSKYLHYFKPNFVFPWFYNLLEFYASSKVRNWDFFFNKTELITQPCCKSASGASAHCAPLISLTFVALISFLCSLISWSHAPVNTIHFLTSSLFAISHRPECAMKSAIALSPFRSQCPHSWLPGALTYQGQIYSFANKEPSFTKASWHYLALGWEETIMCLLCVLRSFATKLEELLDNAPNALKVWSYLGVTVMLMQFKIQV